MKKDNQFEIGEPGILFQCPYAIYPKGKESSICYCTDKARALLIVKALNAYFKNSKSSYRMILRLKKETS